MYQNVIFEARGSGREEGGGGDFGSDEQQKQLDEC